MYRPYTLAIVFLVLYLFGLGAYWLQIGGLVTREFSFLLLPFLGVVGGIFSIRAYGLNGPRTKTLMFLTIGIACWFVGETLWDVYQDILHSNPFPSVADIFYLVAYPAFFLGLLNEIRSSRVNWKRMHPAVIFLLSIASLAIAIVVFYFGIVQAYDPKETILSNVIAMGYGVADLILVVTNMLVLTLVWEFRGGRLSLMWIGIFLGFIFQLLADILFAIYTIQYKQQVFFYKNFLDSIWMLSYILFAYSVFSFGFSILDAHRKIRAKQ